MKGCRCDRLRIARIIHKNYNDFTQNLLSGPNKHKLKIDYKLVVTVDDEYFSDEELRVNELL